MKIWNIGLSVVCCGSLLLSGCSNQDKIRALQGSQNDLQNEIQAVRKQIKAMEEIILTINKQTEEMRLMRATESGARQDAVPEVKSVYGSEPTATARKTLENYTRTEFAARVVGMLPAQLVRFVGEPDNQVVKEGSEYWTYNAVSFKTSETNCESVGIQIVFEDKRVDRMVVMDDIQYGQ